LLPLPRNGGFAYGNNAGIGLAMAAGARAVMLLNPDTIVREGAIAAVSGFLDRNPEVGIAGSLIENPAGGVECSAHRVHTPLSELEGGARLGILSRLLHRQRVSEAPRSEAHSCDWVSGAAMLIRRGVIERIGLMDEGFFLYFEEVDFCWRARQSGWAVWYVPEARVLHLEGASTGIRSVSKRRAAYWYDSRRRYFIKHNGAAGLVLADLLWAAGRCTYLLRRVLGLGAQAPASDPQWLMFDLLWGDVRALMSGAAGRIPRWPK
jgi:GT2 family glycosyltransferase